MKGLSTPREDKQPSEHPVDAGTAPIPHPLRRVGALVSGALLFVAVGSAAALQASSDPPAGSPSKSDATVRLKTTQTRQSVAPAPAPAAAAADDSSSGSSAQVQTSVTVNGQPVAPAADGSINKTITTPDGSTVQINVSQSSSDGAGGSASASINSVNSSSSLDVSSDSSSEQTSGY